MHIGELSRRTGVSIRSLRYYDQKHLLRSHRLANGYRDLDEDAVKRVKTIQMYLSLGLTTEQIAEVIDCPGNLPLPEQLPVCEEALLALYQEKLQEVEDQIALLTEVQARLKERIAWLERAQQQ